MLRCQACIGSAQSDDGGAAGKAPSVCGKIHKGYTCEAQENARVFSLDRRNSIQRSREG